MVDDGSSDCTAEIARRFAATDERFRLLEQANAGASAARNAGFRVTNQRSRYVTFMDSDDVWLPHAMATLLARAEACPTAIGSHGLAEIIDASGFITHPGAYARTGRNRLGREGRRLVVLPPDQPTGFDVLINGNVLFPPGLVMVRRAAYERAGPFDETFNGPEDWDMLIRLSRLGDIEFVDEVLLHYRRHDSNLGAGRTIAEQAWRVRCKAFYSPENTRRQRRSARMGWRAYQCHLIARAARDAFRHVVHREPAAMSRELIRIAAFASRYLRGCPLPRVKTAPLTW